MTDLWCLFGRLAANPAEFSLLPTGFALFALSSIVEQEAGMPAVTTVIRNIGLLSKTPTESTRDAIQAKLDTQFPKAAAPIVSLWAAGRICRLKTVDGAVVNSALAKFNTCYVNAFGANAPTSVHTQTAMGAAMVDENVRAKFLQPASRAEEDARFRLDTTLPEYANFLGFLADPLYQTAQNELLGASCWDRSCPEVMHWYPKFDRAAN